MTKLACVQMASGPNVSANLVEVGRLIDMAAKQGAEMVVLPEHFAQMGNDEDKREIAEKAGEGPIQSFLAETAKRQGVWLVAGALALKSDSGQRLRSTLFVFNAEGDVVARYDKIHLFDVKVPQSEEHYHESNVFEPGDEVVVVETPLGMVGLSICYDIRFPELYRKLLEKGAEILVMPSAFTAITGKMHWQPLLQARAIENQCYVAAAAQGGYHVNGRETYGDSMIVDPWGVILDRLHSGSGFVIADIEKARIESIRKNFPAYNHRRLS